MIKLNDRELVTVSDDCTLKFWNAQVNMVEVMTAETFGAVFFKSEAELSLEHFRVGSDRGIVIAQALEVHRTLQEINLSYNNLGAEGGAAIARALENNSTLQQINLTYDDLRGWAASKVRRVCAAKQGFKLTF